MFFIFYLLSDGVYTSETRKMKRRMTEMKTSTIGYPRIGKNRELKFASEKFFKKEITEEELKSLERKTFLNKKNQV